MNSKPSHRGMQLDHSFNCSFLRGSHLINFLKNIGFSKPQIRLFTKDEPRYLLSDPHKTFLPKIEFFKSKGVPSSDIPKLLCGCPIIMRRSLNNHIIPSFDFFRGLFQSDEESIKTITRTCFSPILADLKTHVVPTMKLLREVGVSESNIIKMLQFHPYKNFQMNFSREFRNNALFTLGIISTPKIVISVHIYLWKQSMKKNH